MNYFMLLALLVGAAHSMCAEQDAIPETHRAPLYIQYTAGSHYCDAQFRIAGEHCAVHLTVCSPEDHKQIIRTVVGTLVKGGLSLEYMPWCQHIDNQSCKCTISALVAEIFTAAEMACVDPRTSFSSHLLRQFLPRRQARL